MLSGKDMEQEPVAVGTAIRSGRPWWQICCGGCFFFIIAAILGSFLLMRAIVGPGVVSLSNLPDNFPKDIVPFHLEQAQSISYLEGKSKSKMLKVFSAPLRLFSQATGQGDVDTGLFAGSSQAAAALGADSLYIDTVTMSWKDFSATRAETVAYYTKQLRQAQMTVDISHDTDFSDSLTGIKEGMIAQVVLQAGANSSTVEELQLVVSYSNKQ